MTAQPTRLVAELPGGSLEAFLRLSPDAAVAADRDGRIRAVNDAACAMFGYRPGELDGVPIEALLPERFRSAHAHRRAGYAGSPRARPMGAGLDLHGWRADGSEFPVDISLAPIAEGGEPLVLAAVRDLTDRFRAQEELMVAADRERIARDLHDLVIQRIFAAGMALQAVVRRLPDEEARRIGSVVDDLDETIRQIRSTIFALESDEKRLGAGLRARVFDAAARAAESLGFEPVLRFTGPVDAVVPDELVEHAVAVVTEGLSNVARHAGASWAAVEVEVGSDLVVRVLDDGRGMVGASRSSGLRNLRERAEPAGGSVSVEDRATGGTSLVWQVPLRR